MLLERLSEQRWGSQQPYPCPTAGPIRMQPDLVACNSALGAYKALFAVWAVGDGIAMVIRCHPGMFPCWWMCETWSNQSWWCATSPVSGLSLAHGNLNSGSLHHIFAPHAGCRQLLHSNQLLCAWELSDVPFGHNSYIPLNAGPVTGKKLSSKWLRPKCGPKPYNCWRCDPCTRGWRKTCLVRHGSVGRRAFCSKLSWLGSAPWQVIAAQWAVWAIMPAKPGPPPYTCWLICFAARWGNSESLGQRQQTFEACTIRPTDPARVNSSLGHKWRHGSANGPGKWHADLCHGDVLGSGISWVLWSMDITHVDM